MLFNTLDFACFFAVVLALYWALPHRAQNLFLLFASYLFYGAWNPWFLGLLALSTVVDFLLGARIARSEVPRHRKLLLGISLGVNLGVLGFFKYFDFFLESLRDLLAQVGLEVTGPTLDILLPVGISFYTFQTLSYTIDIYRRQLEPTSSPLDFALYVSFFPQLVAGPIERASRLLPQFRTPRRLEWGAAQQGSWLIFWGLFKKVVVADNLGHLVDGVFGRGAEPTGVEVALGAYAFAFQLYCDFSGYTDVARGAARWLGFDLMANFHLPYFATSPRDLWTRWHISLSSWLRDYLYLPLGGNRGGTLVTLRNLMVTMLLGGLWHGAAWTFVVWGALHGTYLALHRALTPWLARVQPPGALGRGGWWFVRVLVTFHLWTLALLFFRAESLPAALELLGRLASDPSLGLAGHWLPTLALFLTPLLAVQVWQGLARRQDVVLAAPLPLRSLIYALLLAAMVLLGEDHGAPFLYFQF